MVRFTEDTYIKCNIYIYICRWLQQALRGIFHPSVWWAGMSCIIPDNVMNSISNQKCQFHMRSNLPESHHLYLTQSFSSQCLSTMCFLFITKSTPGCPAELFGGFSWWAIAAEKRHQTSCLIQNHNTQEAPNSVGTTRRPTRCVAASFPPSGRKRGNIVSLIPAAGCMLRSLTASLASHFDLFVQPLGRFEPSHPFRACAEYICSHLQCLDTETMHVHTHTHIDTH